MNEPKKDFESHKIYIKLKIKWEKYVSLKLKF